MCCVYCINEIYFRSERELLMHDCSSLNPETANWWCIKLMSNPPQGEYLLMYTKTYSTHCVFMCHYRAVCISWCEGLHMLRICLMSYDASIPVYFSADMCNSAFNTNILACWASSIRKSDTNQNERSKDIK